MADGSNAEHVPKFSDEVWLMERVCGRWPAWSGIIYGVTTPRLRCERLWQVIERKGWQDRRGKTGTMREVLERLYRVRVCSSSDCQMSSDQLPEPGGPDAQPTGADLWSSVMWKAAC